MRIMGKRGRSSRKEDSSSNRRTRDEDIASEDMDDEIDAFHKRRDVIPLDLNDDSAESEEDNEQPVFDLEGIEDDDDDDDGSDEDDDGDIHDTGFAAKIARQQKYMRAKFGGVEDEMEDDDDEDKEEQKAIWGGKKNRYYDADNRDYEIQSSDDESPAEEEEEVLRLQKEKAKTLSLEDFGLEEIRHDESDRELTLEEISVRGSTKKPLLRKEAGDDMDTIYEEVKKDLNALSREEQMDVLYSSAPELVGLLTELNYALEELENKVNPLVIQVKNGNIVMEGGVRYLELKQLILLSYCQAITFYLLLKSEGHPVRDHPVIARLVELKSLLDKTKQLDNHLPSELENILHKCRGEEVIVKLTKENAPSLLESIAKDCEPSLPSADVREPALGHDRAQLEDLGSLKNDGIKKARKQNQQDDQVGIQSTEMLKVRAALEEKLKQKGIFSSIAAKPDRAKKYLTPVNGQLETYDDFDDDTLDIHANTLSSNKRPRPATTKLNKPKVVSGDDDLPKRDDIGERRRKHELRVLAGAGIRSEDDIGNGVGNPESVGDSDLEENDEEGNDDGGESEDEFYKQAKQLRAAKLTAKVETYSRTAAIPSSPETVDGKRQITYQIEKNRGLTRPRKKLTKNPRKKYKLKYKDAANRRKGQVREIKKPSHPYGGEASGINARISRSIRFKN